MGSWCVYACACVCDRMGARKNFRKQEKSIGFVNFWCNNFALINTTAMTVIFDLHLRRSTPCCKTWARARTQGSTFERLNLSHDSYQTCLLISRLMNILHQPSHINIVIIVVVVVAVVRLIIDYRVHTVSLIKFGDNFLI